METGAVRLTLHGLIQVAAGYHKATRQNQPGGCVRLLEAGLEKLRGVPGDSCGLAIGEFREALVKSLAQARRWQAGKRFSLDPETMVELRPAAARRDERG